MLEYPKDYEEAKQILRDGVDGELEQKLLRRDIIRNNVIYLIILGIFVFVTLRYDNAWLALGVMPGVLPFTIPWVMLYFIRKRNHRIVKSGEYFQNMTESQVIRNAEHYVDMYNAYEAKKKRRHTHSR